MNIAYKTLEVENPFSVSSHASNVRMKRAHCLNARFPTIHVYESRKQEPR